MLDLSYQTRFQKEAKSQAAHTQNGIVTLLLFDWIEGDLVVDAPVGPDGEGRTIDVTVDADFPPGVVVRYVVN